MQPIVQVLDRHGVLQSSFVGSVYVLMGASPSGFEPLYLLNDPTAIGCDEKGYCGSRVVGPLASVKVILGVANFQVLSYIYLHIYIIYKHLINV